MTVNVICGDFGRPDGRFRKGERRSPATEFKPGQHWRPHSKHRDADWLRAAYVDEGRSMSDMAAQAECEFSTIRLWMDKHGIPRRSASEVRAHKHWGVSGEKNPMFGRRGALHHNFVDGSSPERQRVYARAEWTAFLRLIYARDGYRCVRCSAPKRGPRSIHAHHIKPWAGNPELRCDEKNVVTLCRTCHQWVHSKANLAREYIA